jgi:hypothetical protein
LEGFDSFLGALLTYLLLCSEESWWWRRAVSEFVQHQLRELRAASCELRDCDCCSSVIFTDEYFEEGRLMVRQSIPRFSTVYTETFHVEGPAGGDLVWTGEYHYELGGVHLEATFTARAVRLGGQVMGMGGQGTGQIV